MNKDELSFYSYMVIIVHLKHYVSTLIKICRSTHMVCVEAHLDPKVKWFLKLGIFKLKGDNSDIKILTHIEFYPRI
jgi:hypothetical protein